MRSRIPFSRQMIVVWCRVLQVVRHYNRICDNLLTAKRFMRRFSLGAFPGSYGWLSVTKRARLGLVRYRSPPPGEPWTQSLEASFALPYAILFIPYRNMPAAHSGR